MRPHARLGVVGLVVAAVLSAPAPASSDQQNTVTEVQPGQRGLQSGTVYSDMVLRFQFQLVDPNTDGAVFVRTRFRSAIDPTDIGYRVHLTTRTNGDERLGAVTGLNRTVTVGPASLSSPTPRTNAWQDGEIRTVKDALEVRIDGQLIASVRDLREWVGYFGFESTTGRLRVRNVEAEALPVSHEPFGSGAVKLGVGIQDPKVLKEVRPVYFEAARVDGEVLMEAVVEADGTVGDVRLVKTLHPAHDQAAVAAARQWRFLAATQAGKPIPTIVTLALSFRGPPN
jgi:TonB family protein